MEINILAIVGYIFGGLATLYGAAQAIDFFRKKRKEHRAEIADEALEENQDEAEIENMKNEIQNLKKEDERILCKIDRILAEQESARQQFIIETHAWMYRMWFECKKRGYVTSMDLQTIEERYEFYKKRGGNSYVDDLIKEIRQMTRKDVF